MILCVNPPAALAVEANGLPGMDAVGEGSRVAPACGVAWVAGEMTIGLLGEVAVLVTPGAGLEAGEVAASVAGMSYFCTCSR